MKTKSTCKSCEHLGYIEIDGGIDMPLNCVCTLKGHLVNPKKYTCDLHSEKENTNG